MPEYDLRCVKCDARFSIFKKYDDDMDIICPSCNGKKFINIVSKKISVQYKGTGFTKSTSENDKKSK